MSTDTTAPRSGPDSEDSDDDVVLPEYARPAASPGPMRSIGMPAEKSKDFGGSTKRLLGRMRPERIKLMAVVALAVASVTLTVLGPRLLGHATDLIFDAVIHRRGIDFAELRGVLMTVLVLYVAFRVAGPRAGQFL